MPKYPRIKGQRRRPDKDRDGDKNYGKPCVVCGVGTVGEKFVQFSYMRGEDDVIRVCAEHWKLPEDELLDAMRKSYDP